MGWRKFWPTGGMVLILASGESTVEGIACGALAQEALSLGPFNIYVFLGRLLFHSPILPSNLLPKH
jgi:hypothetical protein